jgi:hypothetical protein
MIKNIDELAKFVKGGAEVLQKALNEKDEITIEFVDGRFVTDTDLDEVKKKVFADGKKEGQTIGYDFAMKDLKKDFGIDIEGKDRETIVKTINDTILSKAKIEPNKKITELETSLSNLQKQYETDLTLKTKEIETYKNNLKTVSIVSELQKNTPEIKGLNVNQFMTLARSEFEFDFDENNSLIAKKAGQPIKDKMERPIPVKDILTDFATQNGWFGSPGRGGNNQNGNQSDFKTINDVYRHMEQNKIDPLSAEGVKLIENFKP